MQERRLAGSDQRGLELLPVPQRKRGSQHRVHGGNAFQCKFIFQVAQPSYFGSAHRLCQCSRILSSPAFFFL